MAKTPDTTPGRSGGSSEVSRRRPWRLTRPDGKTVAVGNKHKDAGGNTGNDVMSA